MKNKYYLILILCCFSFGIFSDYFLRIPFLSKLTAIAFLISYHWMYRLGTFRHSPYNKILIIVGVLLFIGFVMMLQHWPYGRWVTASAGGLIMVMYFIHYIKKPSKSALDTFKCLLVTIYFAKNFWYAFSLGYDYNFIPKLAYTGTFLITMILFLRELMSIPGWLDMDRMPDKDPFQLEEFMEGIQPQETRDKPV